MRITDEQIITAVLGSTSNRKAAETLGVSERSLYRRLQSEELQRKLKAAQGVLVNDAVEQMRRSLTEAASVIVSVMNNREYSPQVRINAAVLGLKGYMRLSERQEIIARLEKLEEEYK